MIVEVFDRYGRRVRVGGIGFIRPSHIHVTDDGTDRLVECVSYNWTSQDDQCGEQSTRDTEAHA